ncbi:peptide/nickel transport system substrate-binding protein [Porphyrobacter sp. MBR-155]|jgi:peptide/nickel transport system substrate-binding protein|uniref:ABC transporter substrate-binding protein n=1 Tax=Porphyrobacter sp. MBR-155 TaxID=3156464 RepID=UPI003399F9C1
MLSRRQFVGRSASAVALAGLSVSCTRVDTRNTLRIVPYADLQALDPIVTTIGIVQRHAMMVYDFLFARDAGGMVQPQMVESWDRSADGLTWTFRLREGLFFHDGAPVTADDVIASLRRWSARDAYGRQIFAVTSRIASDDARTVRWQLDRPYGLMLQALSKTGGPVPAIMPRRLAETSVTAPIRDTTGSGPFRFVDAEWIPGGVAVYARNDQYVPRAEPASGAAGGKHVLVDRVEWHNIRDPQSAVLALAAGEVDYVENPTAEFLPMLRGEDVTIVRNDPLGTQGMLRMNHLHPPFDNPLARQALLYLIDQRRYLQAMFGNPDMTQACNEFFVCGSQLGSTAGIPEGFAPDREKARQLLAQSGYDGRPLVILHPTDIQFMNLATLVLADDLRSIGAKVDLQAMDFGAMSSRRANRAAPEDGGWHIGLTYWPGVDVSDPVANSPMQANCDAAWPGWPCDPAHQALIDRYAYAQSDAERQALADQIQASAYRLLPYVPIGLWYNPIAYRNNLQGVLSVPGSSVFWNITKAPANRA